MSSHRKRHAGVRWFFVMGLALWLGACQTPALDEVPTAHQQNLPWQQAGEESSALSPLETATASPANADVEFVRARLQEDGTWTFTVTVRHPDMGWEDYADGWDVVLSDGTVVKASADSPFTRLLLHPHETEQPFTRSQSGLSIPAGVTTVTVRAHDLRDGWGGREVQVDLSQASGPGFEVVR